MTMRGYWIRVAALCFIAWFIYALSGVLIVIVAALVLAPPSCDPAIWLKERLSPEQPGPGHPDRWQDGYSFAHLAIVECGNEMILEQTMESLYDNAFGSHDQFDLGVLRRLEEQGYDRFAKH